jgi:hypothetical protein
MKQFVEKMKVELKELNGRIKRAEQAVEVVPYGADKTSIELLKSQIECMHGYASFLEQRIEYEGGRL